MSEEDGNGRGRPPGVKNGEGKGLAPIANWGPQHDTVVSLHISLHSNKEIAEMVGLSETRVSQILNDPEGKRLVKASQMRLRERMSQDVEDGLASLCVRAVEILRETLEIEGLAHGSDFKKHQDRLAFDIAKGRGFLNKDMSGGVAEKERISEQLAVRIADALEKSNEAAEFVATEKAKKEIVVENTSDEPRIGKFELVKTQ